MELQHFSHEHPLILGEVNDDGGAIVCEGCRENISGSAFSCKNCSYFLHKFCAEFPEEMNHPMHPEHPLTLRHAVPGIFRCDGCYTWLPEFIYRCSICNFNLDTCCALRAPKLKHESHEHPLSLMSSLASFQCHACGTKREGMSYMCDTCSFWIHKDCASLTPTFKHHTHIHPLTLIYPTHEDHYFFTQHTCRICEDSKEEGRFWLYVCIGCMYCIHVKCSTKTKERESAIEVENIDEANLIHLPMADDSISAIDLFFKQISMGDNKRETELNHFSHHHPLILFDAQGDNNLCYENELLILNDLNKDKICNACVRKISAPFYSCGLCDFFLHQWCAELPNELEHPFHPHKLILLKKPPEPRGLFYCEGCEYYCDGFAFKCIEEECMNYCNYHLDVKCAFLPKAIIHKVHEHPLFLKKDCTSAGCAACPRRVWISAFGCDICNFNLHYTCALLPDTIKHRYDEHHPFRLIYAPIQDGPVEYICEFCEDEIDPNWWFYHCIDCDQSACAKCICVERKEDHNIKWGSTYNFDSHSHCLICVPMTDRSLSFNCAYCHERANPYSHVGRIASARSFKCEQCNIMLHPHCPHP
ncbi:hypothetical protein CsSME_00011203 [Camellia sinensis var. sinensis]